jgi:hypothetical protein
MNLQRRRDVLSTHEFLTLSQLMPKDSQPVI